MNKHIDAHCHVLKKDVLSVGVRIILSILKIGEIVRFLDITHLDKLLKNIENLIHFLDIGLNNDTEGIYEEMQKVYNNEYIVTPLMLDLTYVLGDIQNNMLKSFKGEPNQKIHHHLRNSINDYLISAKKQLDKFPANESKILNDKLLRLEKKVMELENKIERFSAEKDDFHLFSKKNFEIQFKQLKELKNNHKESVYPFLSVDPRKEGILDIVKKEVGERKDFIGIKLYAPIGYSPTDPLLYGTSGQYSSDEDCLYNFCLKNDIPITAHCSDAGFATLNNSVNIHGYIYNSDKREIEYVNGAVEFTKKIDILHFRFDSGAIEERAMVLNHPKIWNKVLDKFKNLRLNLAHFGGSGQLHNYINFLEGKKPDYESYSWAETILSFLKKNEFTNFYTDLSCFAETDGMTLSLFKQKLFDTNPDIQSNVLYGSDFYLDMLNVESFEDYLNMFVTEFNNDFDKISISNNKEFLKYIN